MLTPGSLTRQVNTATDPEQCLKPTAPGLFDRIFRPLFWILLLFMALRLMKDSQSMELYHRDLDDLLRLTMLRDWLNGQGWFDYVQHRMLADGLSLHWSRYIDAGLAALLVPLSWILPPASAEAVAIILWPGLLYGLFTALNGQGTRRITGAAAGITAMVSALLWVKLAYIEFAPGRIDHHNVQILGCSVMLFAFGIPQNNRHASLRAGFFAALGLSLSLSAGLEMLPPLLLIWFTAALRMALGDKNMRPWLTAFVLCSVLFLPLVMIGQTAPAEWLSLYCDELAPPVLGLVATGSAATLAGVRASARGWGAGRVSFLMLGLLALGFALASPLLAPCLTGPYSDMTAEARALIPQRILDTQPASGAFLEKGEAFDLIFLPLFVVMIGAGLLGASAWKAIGPSQRWMLVLCLAIAALGLLGSLKQFRAMTMGVTALPFLSGFIAARLIAIWHSGHRPASVLAAAAVIIAGVFPASAMRLPREMLLSPPAQNAVTTVRSRGSCMRQGALRWLDHYPPTLIASDARLGLLMLLETHHSITATPYHRSGSNFWNGYDPFISSQAMLELSDRQPIGFILICRSQDPTNMPFLEDLQNGHFPDWLEVMPDLPPQFLLLRVNRPAQRQEGAEKSL